MPAQDADDRAVTGAAPPGLPAEALGARPGPRSVFFKVLSAFLSGALLVLLFVAIIPKVADFGGVGESLRSMSAVAIGFLVVVAVVIRLLLAEAYVRVIPSLSLGRSLIAREASSAVSNVVPGPSGTATQYLVLNSWGVTAETFARATVAVSVSTNLLIFAMPGAFFLAWAVVGMPAGKEGGNPWPAGLVAVAVSVLSVGVVGAVLRSPRLAATVGRAGQACANVYRRVAGKPPITTWPQRCTEIRRETVEQLRTMRAGLLGCVVGGYLLNGVLLVACLWDCGVSRSDLPLSLGLMLYSVGRLSTVVSITPGGVGVVEVVYTAVFVAVVGESAQNSVVAGVLVYRALTYLLPILTGAVAYLVWRIMRRRALASAAVTA